MTHLTSAPVVTWWSLDGLTTASWWLLGVAGVFAVGDWLSVSGRSPRWRSLGYTCKPATMVALLAVGGTLHPAVPAERRWFLVALSLCLIGDILLMLPGDRPSAFGGGLGAFLLAHASVIAGLLCVGVEWATALVATVVLIAAAALPARAITRALLGGAHRQLAAPVVGYMAALVVMAGFAWSVALGDDRHGHNPWVAIGATLFVVSDTLLGMNRFVRPFNRATLWVHVTYHLAVAALVLSLAGRVVVHPGL